MHSNVKHEMRLFVKNFCSSDGYSLEYWEHLNSKVEIEFEFYKHLSIDTCAPVNTSLQILVSFGIFTKKCTFHL